MLVVPMRHAALVVSLVTGGHRLVPVDDDTDLHIFASYDRRGKHIFTGNSKGMILIVDTENLKVVKKFRLTQTVSNAVKGIEFSRRGESFLVNTADRVIRVYNVKEVLETEEENPEPMQKLQDLVNKTMWKKCCFSGDGEYVCAGSARQHALYIWEKSMGNLVKILHGTKGEILLDVVWHPVRPIVASISQGVVTVWAQQQVENWSAFAPDFKELDENVDYDERESEFDIEDEDRSVQLNEEEKLGDDIEVDVDKSAPIPAFCSSDEEEEEKDALMYLPIAPEIEDPEENWVPGVDPPPDEESPLGASKRSSNSNLDFKENASPKKKRTKTTDIFLQNYPKDEIHPMLAGTKAAKDKIAGVGKRPSGRPKGKDKSKGKRPSGRPKGK